MDIRESRKQHDRFVQSNKPRLCLRARDTYGARLPRYVGDRTALAISTTVHSNSRPLMGPAVGALAHERATEQVASLHDDRVAVGRPASRRSEYTDWMGKGASVRANLKNTRTQINNAATSAQARAFKARQVAKQKREAEARKLRAAQAAAAKATAAEATTGAEEPAEPPTPEE